jgi:hypothetical protein
MPGAQTPLFTGVLRQKWLEMPAKYRVSAFPPKVVTDRSFIDAVHFL